MVTAANWRPNHTGGWSSRAFTCVWSVAYSAIQIPIATVAKPSANTGSSRRPSPRTRIERSSLASLDLAASRTRRKTRAKLRYAPAQAAANAASNPSRTGSPIAERSYGPRSTTTPARTGPKPKPISRNVLYTPKFPPRSASLAAYSLTSATVAGMMSAAPNPWAARSAISCQ